MTELNHLITDGRSHKEFSHTPIPESLIHQLWELTALAPTANNSCPLRVVFAHSADAMEHLAKAAHGYNADRVKTAPAAAILAYDLKFYDQFKVLAPHMSQPPAHASWPPERVERMALMNANIQAGFFILTARSLGLDCGPMGGLRRMPLHRIFGQTGGLTSPSCFWGAGQADALYPRAPRPSFDTACRIV